MICVGRKDEGHNHCYAHEPFGLGGGLKIKPIYADADAKVGLSANCTNITD